MLLYSDLKKRKKKRTSSGRRGHTLYQVPRLPIFWPRASGGAHFAVDMMLPRLRSILWLRQHGIRANLLTYHCKRVIQEPPNEIAASNWPGVLATARIRPVSRGQLGPGLPCLKVNCRAMSSNRIVPINNAEPTALSAISIVALAIRRPL
jgi:hypothetical protein